MNRALVFGRIKCYNPYQRKLSIQIDDDNRKKIININFDESYNNDFYINYFKKRFHHDDIVSVTCKMAIDKKNPDKISLFYESCKFINIKQKKQLNLFDSKEGEMY